MYEELVKMIRGCSYSDPNGCEECRDCPNAENYYECKQKLALQAADAIVMLLIIALVVICICLACPPAHAMECRLGGKPHISEPWEPDEADIIALAQTLYGECRGCSELQQRAVCWCIFNRVDDHRFPDTVVGVITQRCQFFGYKASNPVWDSLYAVAYSCLVDWHNGENRVLEPEFVFFHGTGRINVFTTAYGGGRTWEEE